MVQRAVAGKLSVGEINSAEFHSGNSMEDPNSIIIDGNHLIRVSFCGRVANKYENANTYSSLNVDDDGEKILVKLFDKRTNADKGDFVKVIGKVRESENERFILAEIIKKIDEKELALHHIESKARPARKGGAEEKKEEGTVLVEEID